MKVLRNSSQAARVMYGNVSRAFLRVANWSSAIRMRLCERLCAIHEAENARLLFTKWQNSIQSAWAQSNTFCACLEGAYIIQKTINTLHDSASSFIHATRVAVKYLFVFKRFQTINTRKHTVFWWFLFPKNVGLRSDLGGQCLWLSLHLVTDLRKRRGIT